MILALLVVFLIALIFRQSALALLIATILVTLGMARLWQHWALRRVEYWRELSQLRAFPGDELTLTITMTNRKLLPLAQVQVFDAIPNGITVVGAPVIFSASRQASLIRRSTGLRWYERVIWRYRLHCERRGAFRFGPAQVQSGDPFGLFRTDETFAADATLLVYPKLLNLADLGLPARDPLGLT